MFRFTFFQHLHVQWSCDLFLAISSWKVVVLENNEYYHLTRLLLDMKISLSLNIFILVRKTLFFFSQSLLPRLFLYRYFKFCSVFIFHLRFCWQTDKISRGPDLFALSTVEWVQALSVVEFHNLKICLEYSINITKIIKHIHQIQRNTFLDTVIKAFSFFTFLGMYQELAIILPVC